MKSIKFLSIGLLAVVFSHYSQCGEKYPVNENNNFIFTRVDDSLSINEGDTFSIRLAFQSGTAHFWHNQSFDTSILTLLHQKDTVMDVLSEDNPPIVGRQSIDEFTYQVKSHGDSKLSFYKKAAFQPYSAAIDSAFFTIIAKEIPK